jgi:hypothetical protein
MFLGADERLLEASMAMAGRLGRSVLGVCRPGGIADADVIRAG